MLTVYIIFCRNTNDFIENQICKCGSKIFQARFLNKPTVFVGSNEAVRELLYGIDMFKITT